MTSSGKYCCGKWKRKKKDSWRMCKWSQASLTSSLFISFFLMAFWAAALVATRNPSAASLSLCCWSSFSGYAAAPWKHTESNTVENKENGGVGCCYERFFFLHFVSLKSIIIPEWHVSTHHITLLQRWAGISEYSHGKKGFWNEAGLITELRTSSLDNQLLCRFAKCQ